MITKEINKQRVKRYRMRRAAQGCKYISVMIDAETLEKLNALRKYFGRSQRGKNAPLIKMAIENLYKTTFIE